MTVFKVQRTDDVCSEPWCGHERFEHEVKKVGRRYRKESICHACIALLTSPTDSRAQHWFTER
jgi:hypothetical protein